MTHDVKPPTAADLIEQTDRCLQPSDATLLGDAALRKALLRRDRDALRARFDALAQAFGLPAEHLQVRLTLTLVEDTVARYGLESPAIDPDRATAAGREFLEELAFKCVALDAFVKASSDGQRWIH